MGAELFPGCRCGLIRDSASLRELLDLDPSC